MLAQMTKKLKESLDEQVKEYRKKQEEIQELDRKEDELMVENWCKLANDNRNN